MKKATPPVKASTRRARRSTKQVAPARRVVARSRKVVALARPTYTQIAERAYYLSLERMGEADPVADWLRAEQELHTSTQKT